MTWEAVATFALSFGTQPGSNSVALDAQRNGTRLADQRSQTQRQRFFSPARTRAPATEGHPPGGICAARGLDSLQQYPRSQNRCNARGSSRGNCGPSRGNCGPPRADVSARQPASSGCGYYAMSGETMDL